MGKYQPFFDLPAAQFSGLVSDIAKRGVLLPIIVDENGKTIDGHQRRRAAAEAGVECPQVVVEGLSEDEKQTLALTLNLFRRHLSGTERSKALQQLANLGMSTRRMADILGVSKSTVHNDLRQLSSSGQLDRPDTVTGASGKSYPAQRPAVPDGTPDGRVPSRDTSPPANVDENGEIASTTVDTATSGSDQPTDRAEAPVDGAAGPGDDEQATDEPASSPAPEVAPPDTSAVPIDPTLGYRARVSAEIAKVRNGGLLTIDPLRAVEVADQDSLASLRWIANDLRTWADQLDEALGGRQLKAVK